MEFVFSLRATEGDHAVLVRLDQPEEGQECPITRERIAEYELHFLPGVTWHEKMPLLRRMTLPCKHSFSAMALVYHFVKSRMSCPLCRGGSKHPMSATSLPEHFKRRMMVQVAAERERARDEEERDSMAEVLRLVREDGSAHLFMQAHRLVLTVYAYDLGDAFMPVGVCEYPLEVQTEYVEGGGARMCALLNRGHVRQLATNMRNLGHPDGFVFVVGTRSLDGAVVLLDRSRHVSLAGMTGLGAPQRVPGQYDLMAGFELNVTARDGAREVAHLQWSLPEEHFLTIARLRVMWAAPEVLALSAASTPVVPRADSPVEVIEVD